jgi:hypothetical protein
MTDFTFLMLMASIFYAYELEKNDFRKSNMYVIGLKNEKISISFETQIR